MMLSAEQVEQVRRCIETQRPVPWKLAQAIMDERKVLLSVFERVKVAGGGR